MYDIVIEIEIRRLGHELRLLEASLSSPESPECSCISSHCLFARKSNQLRRRHRSVCPIAV